MPMTPDEIRNALRLNGITQADIAEMQDVSAPTVSLVIDGRTVSTSVQKCIAQIIRKPPEEVFAKNTRKRPGPRPKP